jgi:hypothetical protein
VLLFESISPQGKASGRRANPFSRSNKRLRQQPFYYFHSPTGFIQGRDVKIIKSAMQWHIYFCSMAVLPFTGYRLPNTVSGKGRVFSIRYSVFSVFARWLFYRLPVTGYRIPFPGKKGYSVFGVQYSVFLLDGCFTDYLLTNCTLRNRTSVFRLRSSVSGLIKISANQFNPRHLCAIKRLRLRQPKLQ